MTNIKKYKEIKTNAEHICDRCKRNIPKGSIVMYCCRLSIDDKAKTYGFYICKECIEDAEIDE